MAGKLVESMIGIVGVVEVMLMLMSDGDGH